MYSDVFCLYFDVFRAATPNTSRYTEIRSNTLRTLYFGPNTCIATEYIRIHRNTQEYMSKYMYCGPRARYTQYVSQYIAIHRNTILVIHVLQGARTIHARQSQYMSQYTAIHVARVYLASHARYKCNTCRRHAQYKHNTLAIHVLRPAPLDPLGGDYLFLLCFILLCCGAA